MKNHTIIIDINHAFIQLKKGDRNAFNTIFRYFYPRLMAYAASIVDKQIAEDIVQDVFVYLWHNRKRLNLSDNLTSYLFQAVYTHCLDHLRKNRHAEKYAFFVYENYLEECKSMLKRSEERRVGKECED